MHRIASNKGFRKALIAAFLVAIMVASPLSVFQQGSAATQPVNTRADEMILRVAMQDNVKTLNPLSAGDVWTWNVIGWVFDGLVWRNNTNNDHIEPWAAEWFHHGPENTWDTTVTYPDNDDNQDFRNWTVKLRPDIKWHDWESQTGDDQFVRAHDVIFSLRLVADVPRYMGSLECIVARNDDGSIMYGKDLPENGTIQLINYEGGKVTKLPYWIDLSFQKQYPDLPVVYVWEDDDDLTLHYFTTFEYVDFTIDTLGSLIFPERLWKDHIADKMEWSDPQALINFGPFKFDYVDQDSAKISTFRDYFHTEYDAQGNPKPYIDGVLFLIYKNTDAAIQALQSGKVDYIAWTIDPSYIDDINADPDLTLVRNSDLGFFYVAFNMRIPDFGYAGYNEVDTGTNPTYTGNYTDVGKPFRIAMAHLIDKQTIVQTYLQGFGTVGTSVVSPTNTFWYNPNIKVYRYDPAKANEILDEYAPDSDGDGIRELPHLGEEQITLMTPPADYDPIRQQAGQLIQSIATTKAHLNLKSVPTQFGTIVEKIGQHDFQMYMLGWSIPTPLSSATAPCDFFSSKYDVKNGGNNYPGYHNKTFDELCDKMQREPDINKRRDIAFQLQEAIAEDVPYVVLYYRDVLEAYNNEFQGWVPRYGTIFNWYSLKEIRKVPPSTYEVSLSIPSKVTGGEPMDLTAYVYNKETLAPISGVQVTFKVEGKTVGNATTDSSGKAVVTYTPPSVQNQTAISVSASVYDEAAQTTVTSINIIVVIPKPPPEYNIEMNIIGVPANHVLAVGSEVPVSVDIQVLNASSGEPLGPYDNTTNTGVQISVQISPATGGSFEYQTYSDGVFKYSFTGKADIGKTVTYIVTITATYTKGSHTSTTYDEMKFTVKGPEPPHNTTTTTKTTPSLGVLPVLVSVGAAAMVYNVYRRKRKS